MRLPELRFPGAEHSPFPLGDGPLFIGRGQECDLVITHPKLSKRHAEVRREGDRWLVRDLGSTNGTTVDGVPCEDRQARHLHHGAILKLGAVEAVFHDPEMEPEAAAGAGASLGRGSTPLDPAGRADAPTSPARIRRTPWPRILWGTVVILACALVTVAFARRFFRAPRAGPPAEGSSSSSLARTGDGEMVKGSPGGSEGWRPPREAEDPASGGDPSLTENPDTHAGPRSEHASEGTGGGAGAGDRRQSLDEPFHIDDLDDGDPPTPVDGAVPPDEEGVAAAAGSVPGVSGPAAGAATGPERVPAPAGGGDRGAAGVGPEVEVAAPPAAPPNPLAQALAAGDAATVARLLKKEPYAPGASEARQRLMEEPVYCLGWSGKLPASASAILHEAFPLRISQGDLKAVELLPFPVEVVRRTVRVRHRQDYSVGLGRRVGSTRLPPHPKSITIELWSAPEKGDPERLLKLEGETPRIVPERLGPAGLTEEEIWRRTLEPLLGPLHKELAARGTSSGARDRP
ncbi:MAG: FHA domain-containing protein [Planctomycetota bacterium]